MNCQTIVYNSVEIVDKFKKMYLTILVSLYTIIQECGKIVNKWRAYVR